MRGSAQTASRSPAGAARARAASGNVHEEHHLKGVGARGARQLCCFPLPRAFPASRSAMISQCCVKRGSNGREVPLIAPVCRAFWSWLSAENASLEWKRSGKALLAAARGQRPLHENWRSMDRVKRWPREPAPLNTRKSTVIKCGRLSGRRSPRRFTGTESIHQKFRSPRRLVAVSVGVVSSSGMPCAWMGRGCDST
jgi:hypothetical protein